MAQAGWLLTACAGTIHEALDFDFDFVNRVLDDKFIKAIQFCVIYVVIEIKLS